MGFRVLGLLGVLLERNLIEEASQAFVTAHTRDKLRSDVGGGEDSESYV